MVAIHEELEHRYKAVFQYNNYMYTLYLPVFYMAITNNAAVL